MGGPDTKPSEEGRHTLARGLMARRWESRKENSRNPLERGQGKGGEQGLLVVRS